MASGVARIVICIADRRNPELRVYVPAHQIVQLFARRRDPVARIAEGILYLQKLRIGVQQI
jgi:hypothetical protein